MLSAGTMIGVVRPAPAGGQPKDPSCETPAQVGTYRRGSRQAIISYSCCDETRNAVLVGVAEPQRQPTQRGRNHLQPLRNRLTVDKLDEYCFMIWGLDEKQVKMLFESVPSQLLMEKRDAPK
jgi:hypothetical protein